MKKSPFAIEIEGLRKGKVSMEVDEPPASLDLDIEGYVFAERVSGKLTYQLTEDKVLIRGRLRTAAMAQCVRCLAPAPCEIRVEVGLLYEPKPGEEEYVPDEEGEPATLDYYEGDILDPAEQLRDLIVLELPSVPLCQPQCKGLCPGCGANLNQEECACAPAAPPAQATDSWKAELRKIRLG